MNYVITHLHSDFSNGITNIDSVTKYTEYVDFAKEQNMKAIAFTEHGNVFEWYKKKCYCEDNGIKYIHGVEAYLTETLGERIRDNYHCCLYAKNYEGFLELNKLISKSFNRKDNHFYYVPRITFEELYNTSDNIIITTACIGGVFKSDNIKLKSKFLQFLAKHKDRCFLEIQHHQDEHQKKHNKLMLDAHNLTGIPLIVGTDTHALNDRHSRGRSILQKSKNIFFDNEVGWDITAKTYDELLEALKIQGVIPLKEIEIALNNTNILADRVEEFKIDKSYKYPELYKDGLEVLKSKIIEGIKRRGVYKYDNYESEYVPRINYELDTYIHNGAVNFLLLDEDIKTEMRNRGIYCGYSRGSCSGSIIAYLIGITDIDSIKHKLNFERFMNTERVSLADIDTDWQPNQREEVKDYIYQKEGLYCADIITFNTIALKGSIRDVCRALYMNLDDIPKELRERADSELEHYGKYLDPTSKEIEKYTKRYLDIANYICENIEIDEDKMRREYPDVFEYVDIVNGTIVSIGTHPCGQICSPISLDDNMGLCSISTCKNPVSMISMKSIDAQNYVKLDILGLDNIQLINETCKLANIERLTPENVDDNDINVWKSIRDDNLLIFQWESDSAGAFLKTLLSDETIAKIEAKNPNFRYMDLLSMGNGAIRPAGASYRDALANGEFRDNGHEALNNLLSSTMGYLVYQCQILDFLHLFCGYTMGEADVIRRGFAKKTGTEQFIPDIKKGFIKTMKDKYNVSEEESERLVVDFIKVIEDASSYLFSLNHSEPYSYIGYICGYLRYYYPLEFLTVALNMCGDKQEKTHKIIDYANKLNIKINNPKFRYSKSEYMIDKESNSIYKGINSYKYLNEIVGEELYILKDKEYNNFMELLVDLQDTSINSRQLDILIRLDFFEEFGGSKKLLEEVEIFNSLYSKKVLNLTKLPLGLTLDEIRPFVGKLTEKQGREVDIENLMNYCESKLKNEDLPLKDKFEAMLEYQGYISYKDESWNENVYVITGFKTNKYGTTFVSIYNLKRGESLEIKVYKKTLSRNPLDEYDIIYAVIKDKNKKRKENGEWITLEETEKILESYRKVV